MKPKQRSSLKGKWRRNKNDNDTSRAVSQSHTSSDKDRAIAAMSVDQFFASGLDSDSDGDDNNVMHKGDLHVAETTIAQHEKLDASDQHSSDEQGDEEDFQKSIHKLKESDPTFYKFLEEHDKDVLQSMNENDDKEDEREEEEKYDDADSDSDADSDGPAADTSGLGLAQIRRWEAALAGTGAKSALRQLVAAFREAVARVSGGAAADVGDPDVFNALVRLALTSVPRAVASILQLTSPDRDPSTSKRWVQVKGPLKRFLTDVIQLLHTAGAAGMQRALLRHLLSMTAYVSTERRLAAALVGRLVTLWSSGEQQVRVLAFVNLYRLTRRCQSTLLDTVLKKAYLAYVKHCAFTSASSWPNIHLMRRSLVELYSIDPAVSYQRAFLYIRQLAIHLRNAKLDKKKFQVVYNWQYVHCLLLWSALVGETRSDDLRLLLYPVTQITLGAANLITTARHYPLRLHLVRALTQLSAASGTFVPVLPLLLQVLHQTDFNKRASRVTMRPLDLSCMLRFSEAELKENGFRDAVLAAVVDALTEYLHVESCSLAFPELVVMVRTQLRDFLAKCKVRAYGQRVKELLDCVKQQCDHLERRRQALPFELSDLEAVRRWEHERRAETTPFHSFYQSWRQRHEQEQSRTTPGEDGKMSIRADAARTGSDVSDASDVGGDHLQPLAESGDEVGHEQDDLLTRLQSDGEQEVEDEEDTLAPLSRPAKKKQKTKKGKKRSMSQGKSRKLVKVR